MSKKLTQMQNETIKALDEIWEFYEGDKLALIEFLRGQHKEDHYHGDKSEQRKKEADGIETDLDSKRAFMKQSKKYIRKSVA